VLTGRIPGLGRSNRARGVTDDGRGTFERHLASVSYKTSSLALYSDTSLASPPDGTMTLAYGMGSTSASVVFVPTGLAADHSYGSMPPEGSPKVCGSICGTPL
jgi:hypothetical protein